MKHKIINIILIYFFIAAIVSIKHWHDGRIIVLNEQIAYEKGQVAYFKEVNECARKHYPANKYKAVIRIVRRR